MAVLLREEFGSIHVNCFWPGDHGKSEFAQGAWKWNIPLREHLPDVLRTERVSGL